MVTDASGNIYVTGIFLSGTIDFDPGPGVSLAGPATGSDIWVAKYTSTGTLLWGFGLIGGDDDASLDIALDNANNVYITGYFGLSTPLDFNPGAGNFIPGSEGAFIAKYNTSGTFQWVKVISGSGTPFGKAIASDGSGNLFITGEFGLSPGGVCDFDPGSGTFNLNSTNGRVFIARYNNNGALSWAKNFGGLISDVYDLAIDASNNVYTTGFFSGTSSDFNAGSGTNTLNSTAGSAFLTKYNSSGSFTWAKQVTGQVGDIGLACTVDGSSNVYVTGYLNTSNENIFLSKFNSAGTLNILKSIGGTIDDHGQSLKLDGAGTIYMAGYFRGNNVEFNPGGNPETISVGTPNYPDFFLAKYSTSTLDCQWARNFDLRLTNGYEVNGLAFSNNKIVAAGNFQGNGDFNSCASSTTYNATTQDGFLVGYNKVEPAFSVSGPGEICGPGPLTFTALNIPPGASVTWTASPGTLVSPTSGTGNSFTTNVLPGVTSGDVTATATVAGVCGASASASVHIGLPADVCEPSIVIEPCNTLYATTCSGGATFNWYIDGGLVLTSTTYNAYISLILNPLQAGYHTLCTETQNSCGVSTQACTTFVTGDCGAGQQFAMGYPNPTQAIINFTMEPTDAETLPYNYTYKLIDKSGAVVKTATTNKNSIAINVSDIPKDTYFFKVWLPNQLIQQQIIIN